MTRHLPGSAPHYVCLCVSRNPEMTAHTRNLFFVLLKPISSRLAEFTVDFYKFFNHQIEEHRSKIDFDSEESLDYAEAYLKEQRKQEAQGEFELFSTKQLSNTCFDLWFAGLSTTHITLTWIVGHVLNYPDVQRKLHKELDEVIGSDRLITNDDKNNLPYLNAVINESQRCANIVPINQIHSTSRDTVINGITVKKGTGVIPQISAIMLDDKVRLDLFYKIFL